MDFVDNNLLLGLTGGGSISPSVAGWLHRTTDGGQTWGARLDAFPYPIRSVKYFNDSIMFAVGGSINQDLGGIYSSTNGGLKLESRYSAPVLKCFRTISKRYPMTPSTSGVWARQAEAARTYR